MLACHSKSEVLISKFPHAATLHVTTESRPWLADSVQQFGSEPIVRKSVFQLAVGPQDIPCGAAQMGITVHSLSVHVCACACVCVCIYLCVCALVCSFERLKLVYVCFYGAVVVCLSVRLFPLEQKGADPPPSYLVPPRPAKTSHRVLCRYRYTRCIHPAHHKHNPLFEIRSKLTRPEHNRR